MIEGYELPLVILSVDYIFHLFKEISSYKNIYPEHINGNFEEANINQIHDKTNELLIPYFDHSRNEKKKLFINSGSNAISDVEDIMNSAVDGRIDSLFVKKDTRLYGRYEANERKITRHKRKRLEGQCLLDFTSKTVFLKGGNVYIEDEGQLPEPDSPVNALLRY